MALNPEKNNNLPNTRVFELQSRIANYLQETKDAPSFTLFPQAVLLWYNKFRKDLEVEGFKFNPYDPCVANKIVRDEQFTIRFHVDDLMSSHMDPAVNTEFLKFLNNKYGNTH